MLPIRRLLLRDLLVLMAGVSGLLLLLAWWGQQQALGRQASARTQAATTLVLERLRADLEAPQTLGRVLQSWWSQGTLDLDRPEAVARQVLPLLTAQQSVSSLNLSRTDGHSLLFLRLGGTWSLRELDVPGPQGKIRWRRLDEAGRSLDLGPWTPMAYDPRTRPWYLAGAASPEPVWTDPYTFYTTRDPGITHVVPLRHGDTLQGVLALDFMLDDLTARAWSSLPTPRSRCLLVDGQGRALVLPREPAFEGAEARRQAFLTVPPPSQLGPLAALESWPETSGIRHIKAQGQTHLGLVRPLEGLPGIQWRLRVAIPEEDLLGPMAFRVGSMLGLALFGLALAAWRIQFIARRVAEPITELGVMAENIGQQEPHAPIRTGIQEIRALEGALRQASLGLAEQARLQRQLEHSQRMETVGTLAGGIAHDVNNQLGAILGQLHLSRELLPESHPVQGRLQRAEEATRRCAQTTKALLSFSHQSRPELKAVDVNKVVQETADILDRLLGGRIRLNLSLAPGLPHVAGDAVQLEQVLMNLAVNARDAMPTGGTLQLRTEREAGGRVCLVVQDTGTGIPEAILPHIFEPFVTTKEVGKGTGLGLAMTFGIVKAHHGRIEAENPPEGGARFRITLPPVATPEPSGPRAAWVNPKDLGGALAGRRLLVVEDELLLRDMLADALTQVRAQVTTAQDGEVAWKAWQAGTFDLVLSDQRMPDCTGLELLERIRATGSQVPFILVSGQGLEGAEAVLARDPHLRTLAKPFELPRLTALMLELLGRG